MKMVTLPTLTGALFLAAILSTSSVAQQTGNVVNDSGATRGNAGQASQPAGVNPSVGNTTPAPPPSVPASPTTETQPSTRTMNSADNGDDNPYDPLLEPPPLPKGKTTLIGGIATHVDHVRNRLTVQPFGKGQKVKLIVDERSHIYRDGVETTVLGIHQGDRIYVDTMLDGSKVFARNVRVITQATLAEVRGQVVAYYPDKGTVTVQDQLSSKPVSFNVSGNTKYYGAKGDATSSDLRPGSLVDVQFATARQGRDIAREVTVLAKPGDDYIFSGQIIGVDMHNNSFMVENQSDDQQYEIHFNPTLVANARQLKVGSEVTAHTVFDGKQYKANNLRIESANSEQAGQQSKAE